MQVQAEPLPLGQLDVLGVLNGHLDGLLSSIGHGTCCPVSGGAMKSCSSSPRRLEQCHTLDSYARRSNHIDSMENVGSSGRSCGRIAWRERISSSCSLSWRGSGGIVTLLALRSQSLGMWISCTLTDVLSRYITLAIETLR
jgi:hypothetical protein